nr:MAG TPA: hypothetical protein [Caudoviricetes sp.]
MIESHLRLTLLSFTYALASVTSSTSSANSSGNSSLANA